MEKTTTNTTTDNEFGYIVLSDLVTIIGDVDGTNWTLTLPPDTGTAGQALVTDGTGKTSWATITGNEFDSIILKGLVTVTADAGSTNWTLTLPTNTGTVGQVLVTDGNGNTSWSPPGGIGTVTSVGFTAPTEQFTITNSPITSSGDISLALNAPTGTGKIVLSTSPTINTPLFSGGFEMGFGGGANLVNSTLYFGNKDDTNFTLLKDNNGFALKGFNYGVLRVQDGGDMVTIAGGGTPIVTIHKETFIEADLNVGSVHISGTSNVTTIASSASVDWTMTLPFNGGASNNVLSTDGAGNTSWSTVPSLVSTTGTGSTFVLDTTPTISAPTFTGVSTATDRLEITSTGDTLRLYRASGGDIMYFGTSLGGNTTAKMQFFGTTNDTSNYVQLGYFGGIGGTRFYANADIELDRLSGTGGVLKLPSPSNFTSITTQANTDWTLTLPQNGGTSGYVLSTDGSGVTSWVAQTGGGAGSGTVTSVGYGVDTNYLTLSGTASPITTNGTFTIGLNSPQGTGGKIVLSELPTINEPTITSGLSIDNGTWKTWLDTQAADSDYNFSLPPRLPSAAQILLGPHVLTVDALGNTDWILNLPPATALQVSSNSTAIGSLNTITIPALQTSIAANTTAIATNAGGISTNSGAITTNTTTIGQLSVMADLGPAGIAARAILTDGATLSSVGINVPSFLTASAAITVNGEIDINLNSGVSFLPIDSGGTGAGTATGSGQLVLDTNPTIATPIITSPTVDGLTIMLRAGGGDLIYFGDSIGSNTAAKMQFIGTTNSTSNYAQLGYFGGIGGTRFYANANVELDRLAGVGGKLRLPSATNFTSITTQANADWTLSLPLTGGTAGHVLSTDGSGVTSWVNSLTSPSITTGAFSTSIRSAGNTIFYFPNDMGTSGQILSATGAGATGWIDAAAGSVTSVGLVAPTQFIVSDSPVTTNGNITLALSDPTGTGDFVLENSPTITDPVVKTGNLFTTLKSSGTIDWYFPQVDGEVGQVLQSLGGSGLTLWVDPTIGVTSVGINVASQFTIGSDTSNPILSTGTFELGLFNPTGAGNVVLESNPTIQAANLVGTKLISGDTFLQDSVVYLRGAGDFNHGLAYSALNNGPILFSFSGGATTIGLGPAGASGTVAKFDSSGIVISLGRNLVLDSGGFKTTVSGAATSDWTLLLPPNGGSPNQILSTNGTGTTSWVTPVGGGNTTGTGAVVLETSPTITTPTLETPTLNGTSTVAHIEMAQSGVGIELKDSPLRLSSSNQSRLEHSASNSRVELHALGANPAALMSNNTDTATWDADGFYSHVKTECDSATNFVPPLTISNTASSPSSEIELLHIGSFNMGLDSYQKIRFGQSLAGAGDRGELTFYYNGVDNAANSVILAVGGGGSRGSIRLYNDGRATEFANSIRATARMETFYTSTTQPVSKLTVTRVQNFVQESSLGTDLLTHSNGVFTNNLGYSVSATFSYQASYAGGPVIANFQYWMKHSTLSNAKYGYDIRGDASSWGNGSHTFRLNNGESVEVQVYYSGLEGPISLHGGGNNSLDICRVSYVINN